jgi:hypothetical protein
MISKTRNSSQIQLSQNLFGESKFRRYGESTYVSRPFVKRWNNRNKIQINLPPEANLALEMVYPPLTAGKPLVFHTLFLILLVSIFRANTIVPSYDSIKIADGPKWQKFKKGDSVQWIQTDGRNKYGKINNFVELEWTSSSNKTLNLTLCVITPFHDMGIPSSNYQNLCAILNNLTTRPIWKIFSLQTNILWIPASFIRSIVLFEHNCDKKCFVHNQIHHQQSKNEYILNVIHSCELIEFI